EAEPLTEAERWENSVAGLPSEQLVAAVARRLQEANPGFDGKLTPTVVDGTVTGLALPTDDVQNLSPLRALRELRALDASGGHPREGKLSDLSTLRGLRLTTLICGSNPFDDLRPLEGMPLELLWIGGTRVSDLTPLKGMPVKDLALKNTRVKDLTPL